MTSIFLYLILISIENFRLDLNLNFQLILPMCFHFMRYFVNRIIFRVSHRLLYCVYIEVDFVKNRKCQKYSNFFKSKSIIIHAKTSNGIKIPSFLEKVWG